MATESNVAISPDSVAAGAHNIRTVTVTPLNPVTVGTSEQQQVVTLADGDGNLFSLDAGALPIASEEITMLLSAIITRLDLLNAAVCDDYEPPDELGI